MTPGGRDCILRMSGEDIGPKNWEIREETRMISRARGFRAPCPLCGETQVLVCLDSLGNFYCAKCDREFSRGDLEELIRDWEGIFGWLDTAPTKGLSEA